MLYYTAHLYTIDRNRRFIIVCMVEINFLFVCFLAVLSPHSFSIEDTSSLPSYTHGGMCRLVKTPQSFRFVRKKYLYIKTRFH